MPDSDVAAAFARHEPWITKYELREASSGGWFDAPNDPRLGVFRRCFPAARRILELDALERGHTIGLARLPGVEYVLGVEGRAQNLARARLAQERIAPAKRTPIAWSKATRGGATRKAASMKCLAAFRPIPSGRRSARFARC